MSIFNNPMIPRNILVVEDDVDSDGDYIVRLDKNWFDSGFQNGELVIVKIVKKFENKTILRRTLGTMKYHSKIGDWIVRLFDV